MVFVELVRVLDLTVDAELAVVNVVLREGVAEDDPSRLEDLEEAVVFDPPILLLDLIVFTELVEAVDGELVMNLVVNPVGAVLELWS